MGNEQGREAATVGTEAIGVVSNEGNSEARNEEHQRDEITGCDSPRPSICSDGDLPYISYTVNRPIGDSPKHINKGVRGLRSRGSNSSAPLNQKKRLQRPQEVVVVKEGNSNKTVSDADLLRLQGIPTFLPIMRGALTAPSARDPEVLERLDAVALSSLCRRYEIHLNACAIFISSHQDKLTADIKDTDNVVLALMNSVSERQRSYARYAERLSQVTEMSHLLSRCHASLNAILESMDSLNNILPVEERLEPFIWTTG